MTMERIVDPCRSATLPGISPHVAALLDRTARRLRALVATDAPVLNEAVDYFVGQGGKQVRPLLSLLACEATGGEPADAVDFACAIEMIHWSSLIFDDLPCMDDERERRGQPTLHIVHGEAVAILVALHFLTSAFETVAAADRGGGGAVAILARAITPNGMIAGQLLDITGRHDDDHVRNLKTTPLIEAAVHLGAYAAGADTRRTRALLDYAHRVSLAFQLRDDILDGQTPSESQARAEAIAARAAEGVLASFGRSPAAHMLAGLADYAVRRPA